MYFCKIGACDFLLAPFSSLTAAISPANSGIQATILRCEIKIKKTVCQLSSACPKCWMSIHVWSPVSVIKKSFVGHCDC
jgi:hypothetical protein